MYEYNWSISFQYVWMEATRVRDQGSLRTAFRKPISQLTRKSGPCLTASGHCFPLLQSDQYLHTQAVPDHISSEYPDLRTCSESQRPCMMRSDQCHSPATNEMPSLEELHKRLWSRQAHQYLRIESGSWS